MAGNQTCVRLPDLMVLSEELVAALGVKRATITQDMPAPVLAVKSVSSEKINEDRDYRYKRSEYAARGIAEDWIIDSEKAKFTVLTLVDGFYEEAVFEGDAQIISTSFPLLTLLSAQVLHGGT